MRKKGSVSYPSNQAADVDGQFRKAELTIWKSDGQKAIQSDEENEHGRRFTVGEMYNRLC